MDDLSVEGEEGLKFSSLSHCFLKGGRGVGRLGGVSVGVLPRSYACQYHSLQFDRSQTWLIQTLSPNKNKSSAVQTALIPLTAFQPVPLKVIMGYKYAGYQG